MPSWVSETRHYAADRYNCHDARRENLSIFPDMSIIRKPDQKRIAGAAAGPRKPPSNGLSEPVAGAIGCNYTIKGYL